MHASRTACAVLVHGWPGLPSDFDAVRRRLRRAGVDSVVPDLAGLGEGFTGPILDSQATADAHAERLVGELDDKARGRQIVLAGYDIGSRIAQAALRLEPSRFVGAVLTPAYPGIGDRAAAPDLADRFWYQHFNRQPLASELIDGNPSAVRHYLEHLWEAWSGPSAPATHPHIDLLVPAYARPGAFHAGLSWYRANRGYGTSTPAVDVPVTMLWPTHDPLFDLAWADRLEEFFLDASLQVVEDCGHFVPLEAPGAVANAIVDLAGAGPNNRR
ncbi:MAG: alpha/beta fold hydrolase [Acidimicrobiales bacterium]